MVKTVYMIECAETGRVWTAAFTDSPAALRYIQRFGQPSWRVLPVQLLTRDDVEAMPRGDDVRPPLTLVHVEHRVAQ